MALTDDTEALMLAYVYGELSTSDALSFEQRLAADGELRAEVAGMQASRALFGRDAEFGRSGVDVPPAHLVNAIMNAEAIARPSTLRQSAAAERSLTRSDPASKGFTAKMSRWLLGGGVALGAAAAVFIVVSSPASEGALVQATESGAPATLQLEQGADVAVPPAPLASTPPKAEPAQAEPAPAEVASGELQRDQNAFVADDVIEAAKPRDVPALRARENRPAAEATRAFADDSKLDALHGERVAANERPAAVHAERSAAVAPAEPKAARAGSADARANPADGQVDAFAGERAGDVAGAPMRKGASSKTEAAQKDTADADSGDSVDEGDEGEQRASKKGKKAKDSPPALRLREADKVAPGGGSVGGLTGASNAGPAPTTPTTTSAKPTPMATTAPATTSTAPMPDAAPPAPPPPSKSLAQPKAPAPAKPGPGMASGGSSSSAPSSAPSSGMATGAAPRADEPSLGYEEKPPVMSRDELSEKRRAVRTPLAKESKADRGKGLVDADSERAKRLERANIALATAERELKAKRWLNALDEYSNAEVMDHDRALGATPLLGQMRALVALKRPVDAVKVARKFSRWDVKAFDVVNGVLLGAQIAEQVGDDRLARELWTRLLEVPAEKAKAQAALARLQRSQVMRQKATDMESEAAQAAPASDSAKE